MADANNVKYGFYYIDREYLDKLHEGDTHVPKHNYEDEGRSRKYYCGPVMNEFGVNYFVPVSSQTGKDDMIIPGSAYNGAVEHFGILLPDEKGHSKGGSNLDFRFMIPCVNSELLTPMAPKSNYAKNQAKFCMSNEKRICREAYDTYQNIQSGEYSFLNESAINQQAVYDKMWEYEDILETRREIKEKRAKMTARASETSRIAPNESVVSSDLENQRT